MDNLTELFSLVFDCNGSIRPCGRNACRRLISALQEKDTSVRFGSIITGQMNVDAVMDYGKTHGFLTI